MHHRLIANEYSQIKVLGRGAFAEVFLAKHLPSSQLFALKSLPFKEATTEDQKRERAAAEREVEVLCQLVHPNITLYKESFLDNDKQRLNVVLEFCEKGTLAGVIKSQRQQQKNRYISEEKIWIWSSQLLFAVSYIHTCGIIHRDIKPANIFLTKMDQIKLGDFGIAKVASGSASLSCNGGLLGTPFYLSPEVCDNDEATNKSDIWALGVSLYELCSLRLPFPGTNVLAVLNSVMNTTPSSLPPQYSVKLNRFIFSMLAKAPKDRPEALSLITEFVRREQIVRMERAFIQHRELVPPGLPLKFVSSQSRSGKNRVIAVVGATKSKEQLDLVARRESTKNDGLKDFISSSLDSESTEEKSRVIVSSKDVNSDGGEVMLQQRGWQPGIEIYVPRAIRPDGEPIFVLPPAECPGGSVTRHGVQNLISNSALVAHWSSLYETAAVEQFSISEAVGKQANSSSCELSGRNERPCESFSIENVPLKDPFVRNGSYHSSDTFPLFPSVAWNNNDFLSSSANCQQTHHHPRNAAGITASNAHQKPSDSVTANAHLSQKLSKRTNDSFICPCVIT